MPAFISVLAGVNGAGKSSIGGAALQSQNINFFNPDLFAKKLLERRIVSSLEEANAQAWEMGRAGLARAIDASENFAFESTLGAKTIPNMLLDAAGKGAQVHVWFAGLSSPELHIARVRSRVANGGHDIPEAKIRERYDTSRANLVRLLPHLTSLRLYDNSQEGDPTRGVAPQPLLLLHVECTRTVFVKSSIPQWAKPIVAVAFKLQR